MGPQLWTLGLLRGPLCVGVYYKCPPAFWRAIFWEVPEQGIANAPVPSQEFCRTFYEGLEKSLN